MNEKAPFPAGLSSSKESFEPVSHITDVFEHPAVRAWRRISKAGPAPHAVESLKETSRSSVYRLIGVGVIAKRAKVATALVERTVYEDILPSLPISAPRFDGFLREENPAFCWLFLEDSGGAECSFENPAHRALASRWIAQLHVSAARDAAPAGLPSRSLDHYIAEMQKARSAIRENLWNPSLTAADRADLETLIGLCDRLDSQWTRIAEQCANIPATLVHNDFCSKNAHIRPGSNGPSLHVLDWEYAGWGLPATDLGDLDLEAYIRVTGTDRPKLERLASLGRLLRCISSIKWATTHLAYETAEKGMKKLRLYPADMRTALSEIGAG